MELILESDIIEAYLNENIDEYDVVELYSEGYISENTMGLLLSEDDYISEAFDNVLYEMEALEETKLERIGIRAKMYPKIAGQFLKSKLSRKSPDRQLAYNTMRNFQGKLQRKIDANLDADKHEKLANMASKKAKEAAKKGGIGGILSSAMRRGQASFHGALADSKRKKSLS